MQERDLSTVSRDIHRLNVKVMTWKFTPNQYSDIIALATHRRENRLLLIELYRFDKVLIGEDRKIFGIVKLNQVLIDAQIEEAFVLLLKDVDLTVPDVPVPSLKVAVYELVSVIAMIDLQTEQNFYSLLKEYMELYATLVDMRQEDTPLCRIVKQGYEVVRDYGRTLFSMRFASGVTLFP